MSEEIINSDDSYSDDDEEEELDPRIQDELEKLNAATNSINHLEAELDEARAVFRQTLAGATYHLNSIAQKLGKCVEKSRPFYEAFRQLRQSHGMLQKSTNQFERATGMHVAARTRVLDAENRVFGGGSKRTFDPALQEMLNQATIEVNEAEKLKRDSWKQHQEDLKAYRDLELKVKRLYKKLKSSVDKSKPYFEQKKEFDRHLWQLKLRVDSILLGLSGAKENYSVCLKSLEIISDEIHEKRKRKRMELMLSKLQEREAGVGADSSTEEETSLSASNLDLDFDSSLNFDKLDGLPADLTKDLQALSTAATSSIACYSMSVSEEGNIHESQCENHDKQQMNQPPQNDTRVVYGLEATEDKSNLSAMQAEVGKDELELNKSSLEIGNIKEEPVEECEKHYPEKEEMIFVVQIEEEKDNSHNLQEKLIEDVIKSEDGSGKDEERGEQDVFATEKESTAHKMQDHEETLHQSNVVNVPQNPGTQKTVPQDSEDITHNEEQEHNMDGNAPQGQNHQVEETLQEKDESAKAVDSDSKDQLCYTYNQESCEEVIKDRDTSTDQSTGLSNDSEAKAYEPVLPTNKIEKEDDSGPTDVSILQEIDNAPDKKERLEGSTVLDECSSQEKDSK